MKHIDFYSYYYFLGPIQINSILYGHHIKNQLLTLDISKAIFSQEHSLIDGISPFNV